MALSLGIDLGSAAIKAALLDNGVLRWLGKIPTAPGHERLALELMEKALAEAGLAQGSIGVVGATGYGKSLIGFADYRMDEITANARGLHDLSGGKCRVAINIGGQDLKVIRLGPNGQVDDFRMNDKCAAGTGRFLEQAARILDCPVESFGDLAKNSDEPADLSSTCAVFAESEMVSLLARGASRASVVKGIHRSVARRVVALAGKSAETAKDGEIWLDGGPSQNEGLKKALEEELLREVSVAPNPQHTVAYGAALLAAKGRGG